MQEWRPRRGTARPPSANPFVQGAPAFLALAGWLGHPPRAFAYPNGDHDDRVRRLVADAGYELAFAFDHRLSDVPPADPLAVSRLRVDVGATVDRLDLLLSGLHSAVHHRLGRA